MTDDEWESELKLPSVASAEFGQKLVMNYLCNKEGGHDMSEYIMNTFLTKCVKTRLAFEVGMSWAEELVVTPPEILQHDLDVYLTVIRTSLELWINER